MWPPKNAKQVVDFLGLVGYYQKFIEIFAYIANPLIILMHHNANLTGHQPTKQHSLPLKGVFIQVPILHYPGHLKWYTVYTNTSDDACAAQLSKEHNGQELPVAFLLHTFTDTQYKWNIPEQEAYGVYFATTKWNNYLQGSYIIMQNDH